MIPYQNCEVIASVLFFFTVNFFCYISKIYRASMYDNNKRQPTLTSIPERNEYEEEKMTKKWVPKKKHEVLKAKYKCLKKLFQIYDASVIGILPEPYPPNEIQEEEEITSKRRRKKRSHRTKTNACAGTTAISCGDVTCSESDRESIPSVIRELKHTQCSTMQIESKSVISKIDKYATTQSVDNVTVDKECECSQCMDIPRPVPYLMINEKRKLTRFQCFIQRIFGIRQDRYYKNYSLPNGHVYASSDNNISRNYCERKRRRGGLRFRRLRRPKKIQSDGALRHSKSPVILTYVRSVQRNCLMDSTPRQCPILACRMIFYGIINYNDHLNLCHFTDRKYVCHYCHEGFEREYDKFLHENEHIGINKLNTNISAPSTPQQYTKKASDTQTDPELAKCDVQEEKLKKIVSFFDKIADPDKVITELKKSRCSESNLQSQKSKTDTTVTTADGNSSDSSDKRTVSCMNLPRKVPMRKYTSSAESEATSKHPFGSPVNCHFCGETFDFRRQLSLHVDLEHRVHDKFSKFHSCAGIVNYRRPKRIDMISQDGLINVQSVDKSRSAIRRVGTSSTLSGSYVARVKSDDSLSCDPSTNIVYYTSLESVKKPSVMNSVLRKVKNGINYKWEPGTKIIRV